MRRGSRLLAGLAVLLLVSGCAQSATREEVLAFLDTTYQADSTRADTWRSPLAVAQTADRIADTVRPRDRFTEQQAEFMRSGDYAIAVFGEDTGARVEFDTYERIRARYLPLIVGYWGPSPTTYGPRGERASRTGGGFRGGGPGFGK